MYAADGAFGKRLRAAMTAESEKQKTSGVRFHSTGASDFDVAEAWAALPPELQAAVLEKLPLRQAVRARRVCSAWKVLLDDVCRLGTRRLTLDNWRWWSSEDPAPPEIPDLMNLEVMDRRQRQHFLATLDFLTPRCPLRSLEFGRLLNDEKVRDTLARVAAAAATAKMQLRSLAVYNLVVTYSQDILQLLATLIQRQPMLVTLVLGPFYATEKVMRIPPAVVDEIEKLQHLRTLALFLDSVEEVRLFKASTLGRLDCLALHHRVDSQAKLRTVVAALCDYVAETAPGLRRRQLGSSAEDVVRLVWAKEGVLFEAAMADPTLHSRNFFTDLWETLYYH